ncbi:GNAT family N-acetyltransferase, partial [Patescibacteria group bacterium]|nr:GNAT family N-acetyltransferase [Patescibacteria group bacterium]
FKIGYHMMPNLPGSDPKMDVEMFRELFSNQYYQPDYLKIYPCVVMPKTTLSLWYRQGKYKSYSDKILAEVLYEALKLIPEWCRVDRVARDIPSNEIESGFKVSNIRQILEKRFLDEGVRLRDIRVREVGVAKIKNEEFVLREYDASLGEELFLSYEDLKQDKLLALLRLRFLARPFIKALKGAAVVREVHVYGRQIAVGAGSKGEKQHSGYGKKLMKEAEKLAKEAGYKKIAVIAGIGTREYYRKFGYKLVGGYMLKDL